nr:hypothetical protein [Tanacetum cinerariifolium]
MELWYSKDTGMSLTAYADADHAGFQDTRRRTSGRAGGEWNTGTLLCSDEISTGLYLYQTLTRKIQFLDQEARYEKPVFGNAETSDIERGRVKVVTRGVTPLKKTQKFKKPASPKLSTILISPKEPIRKSKRVKRPAKKSTNVPTTGVVMRETPVMSLSKKKEKVTVEKRKGINLLSEVALTEEAQYEEIQKKSLRDFHKTRPSGSGTVTKIALSAEKIKPSITNERIGAKTRVPDVTEEELTKKNYPTLPKTQVMKRVTTFIPVTSVEDKASRRLEVKERSTLMMGIPNKHQLKFNSIKDAKQLMEVIEKRFDLNTMSMDDLNNNLKIYPNDLEEMDLRWQMAMLTMRSKRECTATRSQDAKHKKSIRRTVPIESPALIALVSCDGLGGYDWCNQAEEGPNYALMAYTSTSSNSKIVDNCKKGLWYENYNVVPPPYTGNFIPPKHDLCFTGLDEFANKLVVENCDAKTSKTKPKDVRKNNDALIIKEWVSDDEEEEVTQPKIEQKTVKPSIPMIEFVKPKQPEKKARKTVKKYSLPLLGSSSTLFPLSLEEDISTFNFSSDHEDDEEADMNNMDITIQMDVKSAFLNEKIEEEVYVCQLSGFEDLYFLDKVYKDKKKALYGLHQAPRAWFTKVKNASTPMETQKPLLKDEDGEEVDVHIYRYLKGQPKFGLWYPKDSLFDLVAYTDSDYARASLDRKSITRGCQFLGYILQQKLDM